MYWVGTFSLTRLKRLSICVFKLLNAPRHLTNHLLNRLGSYPNVVLFSVVFKFDYPLCHLAKELVIQL